MRLHSEFAPSLSFGFLCSYLNGGRCQGCFLARPQLWYASRTYAKKHLQLAVRPAGKDSLSI